MGQTTSTPMQQTFIRAVSKDNLAQVQQDVARGDVDVNGINNFIGWSALHRSCVNGRYEMTKYLLESGRAHVDTRTKDGETALHLACREGHLNIVQLLIQYGANVEEQNDRERDDDFGVLPTYRFRALHYACGDLKIIQYLLTECHAEVNATDNNGRSALHFACCGQQLQIVQYLLDEHGADIDILDTNGKSPYDIAHRTKVRPYLDQRAQKCTGKDGIVKAQFISAARSGNLILMKQCVAKGVNVNAHFKGSRARGYDGITALHLASRNGHMKIIRYLMEECHASAASIDAVGQTPYDLAKKSDISAYLSQTYKIANAVDTGAMEVMFISAARKGDFRVVKQCILDGVDVETKDDGRYTDLLWANRDGWTALYWAAFLGHMKIVKYLVETCGATIDIAFQPPGSSAHKWRPQIVAYRYLSKKLSQR
jgi:ankyrin repeat protein